MSRPPEYGSGAYGADSANSATGAYGVPGADPAVGGPQDPPNVYVPFAVPPPEYDGYADPAAAHGWQNAYDATQELPPVVDGEGGRPVGDHDPAAADRPRHTSGRRSRRRPSPWRSRRVAVAAGAAGALAAAALMAGFAFSGSQSGGPQGSDDRTSPAVGKPATPGATDPASSAGSASSGRPSDAGPGAVPSGAPSASPSTSTSGSGSDGGTKDPSTKSPTVTPTPIPTPTPTSSTPIDSGPGNSDRKPGHGPGGTKSPR